MQHGWSAIVNGKQAEDTRAVLADIGAALEKVEPQLPGLCGGAAGLALFWSYYAAAFDDPAAEQRAAVLLDTALSRLLGEPMTPLLADGLTGIGWVVEHLAGSEASEDDPIAGIDDALATQLAAETWDVPYELLHGLAGYALYALERLPRPSAVAILERIVYHLERLAEAREPGLTWHTPVRRLPKQQAEQAPNGYYNLGLAHGVPGAVAVLGRIVAARIAVERARPLLDGAVAWLLAQRLPTSEARYPAWIADRGDDQPTRSAWCYGDPGVAIALLAAARCVGEPTWEQAALDLAHGAAVRPPARRGIFDAGLCHGSVGLAHIFTRFFHATHDPLFRAAAIEEIEHTFSLRQPGRGIAGFVPWAPDTGLPEADPSLLVGGAGIGLALLAACTDIEPSWDRVLLIEVPQLESDHE